MASKRQRKNTTKAESRATIARRARVPESMLRKVPGRTKSERAEQRKEFKKHGFRVAGNYVVVDGPRDRKRKPIKGAKVELLKGGIVKITAGKRRDYIVGFTKKEKQDFAVFGEGFAENKYKYLQKIFPTLKRVKKPQTRLQWGAYQATKDYAPSYFTNKYFASVSPEDRRREGKQAGPRADKLTGLHFVVHVRSTKKKKSKANKSKGAKRGKGKRK